MWSFYGMINIKIFDSNLIKIDKKAIKNIRIYYSVYIKMKDFDYINIRNVRPLYFIIGEVDGYAEEKNGNRYLILLLQIERKKH